MSHYSLTPHNASSLFTQHLIFSQLSPQAIFQVYLC